jgi:surface polysaccharide O-acyltransferase-like enzyme
VCEVVENQQLSLDVARVAAITSVILLHSAAAPYSQVMDPYFVVRWFTWDIFESVAWIGVPLFIMISGALLLNPSKADEPLKVFFKKRWKKIGLPLIFWGAAYFAWSVIVNQSALSADLVLKSVLNGPYFQFWYIYMLIGLYLATPILRVLVANMTRHIFTYLIIVWLAGLILMPALRLFGESNVANYFFVFSGYLGCYLFGAYLRNVKLKSAVLYGLLAVGLGWSILGNYFIMGTFGEKFNYFILGNLTANTILTATALFLILTKITYSNPLFRFIGKNTLTIYLFHVMVLQSFQNGYFGFVISAATFNLALEVPLITAATLLVTTLVIVPMKKMPLMNRLLS